MVMLRYGLILLLLVVCVVPRIWFTTSLQNVFLLIRNKPPYRKYLTLCKLKKRVSHKLGGGFSNYLMLCLIILLRKMKYLISFIMSRDYLDSCDGCVFRKEHQMKLKFYWIICWQMKIIGHFLNQLLSQLRRREVLPLENALVFPWGGKGDAAK